MGQQQLILLVLATVIVGLAIVVGIRAFTENSAKANLDAMTQDAIRIANDMQAWSKKPAPFGGQEAVNATASNDPADFSDATFPLLGYSPTSTGDLEYENLNGTFTLDASAGTITAVSNQEENQVTITVNGQTDEDISSSVNCLGGDEVSTGGCSAFTTT